MIKVIVPVVLLFVVILAPIKRIRNFQIHLGLLIAAFAAFIMGGVGPFDAVKAGIGGIDRISWIIGLSVFGSIYAQSQVVMGTVNTVLQTFRASIGKTPKGLTATIILTLVLAGSLLGDAIAAAAVIGILVIKALDDLELSPEKMGAIILMGAVLGSIMPPITQAIFLSASLMEPPIDPTPVANWGYITVGICVIIAILTSWKFLKIKKLPESLIPERTVGQILSQEWKLLIPLFVLILLVVLRTGPKIDVLGFTKPIFEPLTGIWVIRAVFGSGGVNRTLQFIIVATIVAFFYPAVRKNGSKVIKDGLTSVTKTVLVQICAGIMIGSFYAAGMIDLVLEYTQSLSDTAVKLGGGFALMLVGMLTGSQTTAQQTIVTFMGPVLTNNLGVAAVPAALGSAHLAAAGQSMPPACLTCFVVVGIVGGILNKKADPVRIMLYCLPITIASAIIGFFLWFAF